MTAMRRFALPPIVVLAIAAAGCDQLNKPLSTSSSSSSSSSGGSSAAAATDGGDGEDEAGSPAPTFTAQPGDIQL